MAETNVSVLNSGAKMGPSGDAKHMQMSQKPGFSAANRTKSMCESGGTMVTSPAAAVSKTMDLEKRP